MYRANKNNKYDTFRRGNYYFVCLRSILSGKVLKVYHDTKTNDIKMHESNLSVFIRNYFRSTEHKNMEERR